MAAYVIAQVTVTNPEDYVKYSSKTGDLAAKFGGKFLAKGGEMRCLEGPCHQRNVIIEFPDMEAAQRWYDSPEYQAILPIRKENSESTFLIVNGL